MAAREIVSGIWEIDTRPLGQERLIASYPVLGESSAALIDPGFSCSAQTVQDGLAHAGVTPADLTHIVRTCSPSSSRTAWSAASSPTPPAGTSARPRARSASRPSAWSRRCTIPTAFAAR